MFRSSLEKSTTAADHMLIKIQPCLRGALGVCHTYQLFHRDFSVYDKFLLQKHLAPVGSPILKVKEFLHKNELETILQINNVQALLYSNSWSHVVPMNRREQQRKERRPGSGIDCHDHGGFHSSVEEHLLFMM